MTTLTSLTSRTLDAIADPTGLVWTAAQVQEWLRDAIRDYAQFFPRQLETTITTTAGVRRYDLPTALQTILLVEYPTGQDPPDYLALRPRSHSFFWNRSGYYDYRIVGDPTASPELFLSEVPVADETITVTYLAPHPANLDPGDDITVPPGHEPILILFAIMMAWQHRLAREQQSPTSNSTLLLSQFATNADRARRNYVQALGRARIAAAGTSAQSTWRMDKFDRIY
jgi:hypothetical protein